MIIHGFLLSGLMSVNCLHSVHDNVSDNKNKAPERQNQSETLKWIATDRRKQFLAKFFGASLDFQSRYTRVRQCFSHPLEAGIIIRFTQHHSATKAPKAKDRPAASINFIQ
jgi:hypothetical protein